MPPVVYTNEFNKCLRDLLKIGKKGKDAVLRARGAQTEAGSEGSILSLQRTHHGEDRLPDAEKYDLGDGYRLVVQLVDGKKGIRAFLFAGDHDDAERWLQNHRNYRWVKRPTDGTLDFVLVSERSTPSWARPDLDLESPETLLGLPLLRDLTEDEWAILELPEAVRQYAKGITAEDWERDPDGMMEHIAQLSTVNAATLVVDLLHHAHKREWTALHRRVELKQGTARLATGPEAASAMLDPVNSETFVTWDDNRELPPDEGWADWMLFLHREQKDIAKRDLAGPAPSRSIRQRQNVCHGPSRPIFGQKTPTTDHGCHPHREHAQAAR